MSWTHLLTHFFNDKVEWKKLVEETVNFKAKLIEEIIKRCKK